MRPRYLEDAEQRAFMSWLELAHPTWAPCTFHAPNGGARSAAQAGIFKALGVRPGVPDIMCIRPAGGFVGLAIEMKKPKATPSSVSADQRGWILRLREYGWRAEVARGFDPARLIFESYITAAPPDPAHSWAV